MMRRHVTSNRGRSDNRRRYGEAQPAVIGRRRLHLRRLSETAVSTSAILRTGFVRVLRRIIVTTPVFVSDHRSIVNDISVSMLSVIVHAGTILVAALFMVSVFMLIVRSFGNV